MTINFFRVQVEFLHDNALPNLEMEANGNKWSQVNLGMKAFVM